MNVGRTDAPENSLFGAHSNSIGGNDPPPQNPEITFQQGFLRCIQGSNLDLLKENLAEYAKTLIENAESYSHTPEGQKPHLIALANNPNNIEVLRDRLLTQAGRVMTLQETEQAIGVITQDELLNPVGIVKDNFFSNLEEAYDRAQSHQENSLQIFFQSDLTSPTLEKIEVIGGSDPHNGGKQACFLRYNAWQSSNSCLPWKGPLSEEVTIVYKPRNMEIEKSMINTEDSAFSLINDICGQNALPTFRIVSQQDRGEHYGFEEFIPPSFPQYKGNNSQEQEAHDQRMKARGLDDSEVHAFFKRVGMLQFAAQLFGITDLNASNLIVSGNHEEGYMIYPIDLEATLDIRVLKDKYVTGLSEGLGLTKSGENFIVTRDGNSPRGRRPFLDHPEDKQAVIEGFKFLRTVLNTSEAKRRLLNFFSRSRAANPALSHRFVPIPTPTLRNAIEENNREESEQEFMSALMNSFNHDIDMCEGSSLILPNSRQLLAEFRSDKIKADIPFFLIQNGTGEVTYNGVSVGRLSYSSALDQLFLNIQNSQDLKIMWDLPRTQDWPDD